MNTYEWFLISFLIFSFSILGIYLIKTKNRNEIKAQFVITTGLLLLAFYIVGIISGICTIFNFVWTWFF